MKTKRFNVKTKQFEEIDFKLDPTIVLEAIEADEAAQKAALPKKSPLTAKYEGGLDEYGREIPDPRPVVVETKPLTKEQKVMNQFILAHNKAVLERDNLPYDFSTPEAARESIKEMLDLDMEMEVPEFISDYEYMPMAENWDEVYPQVVQPEEATPTP